MDEILRESAPEGPGQGADQGGCKGRGPAVWIESEELTGAEIDAKDRRVDSSVLARERGEPSVTLGARKPSGPSPEEPEDLHSDTADELAAGAAQDAEDEVEEVETPASAEALSRILCALLLSSKDSQSLLRLAQATNTSSKAVKAALEVLRQTIEDSDLPLEVDISGEQVRFLTTPDVFGYLRNLRSVKKQEKLSPAALETLAVVAYRQPVMRAEIEAIRGVKAGPILRTLLDHRMIRIVGRADVPGRPLQYGTTQHFLETFGLENLQDLPSVKEFRSL